MTFHSRYSGTVNSPTSVTALIGIDPFATTGPRDVTVITGAEQASLANGFTVSAALGTAPGIGSITNEVSLLDFNVSRVFNPLCGLDVIPPCFSIQQNFFIVTPGYVFPEKANLTGEYTYWAQNTVTVREIGPGVLSACGNFQVFSSRAMNNILQFYTNCFELLPSFNLPATFKLTSTLSESTLKLEIYSNQSLLLAYTFTNTATGLPLLNGLSYIGYAETPAPPELVLVGPGHFANATFSPTTTGSVASMITLSDGRPAAKILERGVKGVGVKCPPPYTGDCPETQTGETSVGLVWPGLSDLPDSWIPASTATFLSYSPSNPPGGPSQDLEGIWFQPVPSGYSGPYIQSVTPIQAQPSQGIIISGSGFGNTPPLGFNIVGESPDVVNTSSCGVTTPSLAIQDSAPAPDLWEAGLETCTSSDPIGVKVAGGWSDSQFVLNGFGSAVLGNASSSQPYQIAAGDPLTITVNGPNNSGSAIYNLLVSSDTPIAPSGAITVQIPAGQAFTDTGIAVNAGDTVTISASGLITLTTDGHIPPLSPAGFPPNCAATEPVYGQVNLSAFVAPELPCWSLIGKIGANGSIFEVGTATTLQASTSGELFLGVNDNFFPDNSGNWNVSISIVP